MHRVRRHEERLEVPGFVSKRIQLRCPGGDERQEPVLCARRRDTQGWPSESEGVCLRRGLCPWEASGEHPLARQGAERGPPGRPTVRRRRERMTRATREPGRQGDGQPGGTCGDGRPDPECDGKAVMVARG